MDTNDSNPQFEEANINEEVEETDETVEPTEQTEPEVRPQETPEAKLARLKRQTSQLEKKLGLSKEEKTAVKTLQQSGDLDFGQLAFYNTKSDIVKIESDSDVDFLRKTIEDTGKSQQAILASKWFQSELKEQREAKASVNAVPKGPKRSSQPARDDLSVAIAKYEESGQLPEDRMLREKVVDAKIQKEKGGGQFSNSPIVQGGASLG